MLAPIVIFAFNRPTALDRALSALKVNPEAIDSDIYIFIDGPREGNDDDRIKIDKIHALLNNIQGFRSVTTKFSNHNQGLGPSIISGVSEIISKYGKTIVMEDDLVVQANFLKFMNEGLIKYHECSDVFSICGYTNRIKPPKDYPYDAYCDTRSSKGLSV